jgi:hypothetical protein
MENNLNDELKIGVLRYDEGEWIMYTSWYNGMRSNPVPLHPNERRSWMHQYQMVGFPTLGKKVAYKIVESDGVTYAVTDVTKFRTSSVESMLDIILQEIESIKWMIRDLDSKV